MTSQLLQSCSDVPPNISGRLLVGVIDQPQALGKRHKICNRMCAKFGDDALPVSFDGALGNSQSKRGLFVHFSAYYEIENLAFPGGESFQQRACVAQPL